MLSVDEAQGMTVRSVSPLGELELPLEEAQGRILSEDLRTPIAMPPFSRSAMDGYAIRHKDLSKTERFLIVGSSDAGSKEVQGIGEGEASRVHTGAMVPEGADAVIEQEQVEKDGDGIRILKEELRPGSNIRPVGEEMGTGELALERGAFLNSVAIAFLASLGFTGVKVHQRPRVAVLVTGDELCAPGEELPWGSIYESNSFGIRAALKREGFELHHSAKVPDDAPKTVEAVKKALKVCDLLLLSGGISVGDRDHVKEALLANGLEQRFHKVAQKPGKPLFFGEGEGKAAFGLPGNPAATMVCLYEYVLPYLRASAGDPSPFPERLKLPLLNGWDKKPDRTVFLKARLEKEGVRILEDQSSSMLRSFSRANALAILTPEEGARKPGDPIEVDLLE